MRGHLNFHKTNIGFERNKWALKHQFCIEQCRCLNVGEILYRIPYEHALNLIPWTPPGFPRLKLVPGRGGIFIKWWLLCPICSQKRENLYIPPNGQPGDWRCRLCHSLVYSSQRFGHRHPLRKVLTPRKKRTKQKEAIRQNRIFARQKAQQQKLLQKQEEPIVDKNFIPMMKEMERFIASGGSITLKVESRNFEVPVNPHQDEIESMLDDAALEAKSILENLAVNGKTRSIRAEARRTLDRENKIRTIPDKRPQKTEKPCPPPISFSAAELDRIRAVMLAVGPKP